MGVAATGDRFIISVPRLMGYKTLVVNIVLILFGLASAIWPKLVTPDPQAIGILFDQGTGLVVALVGIVNAVLRLQTVGPAGPFMPAKSEDAKSEVTAVVLGSGKITKVGGDGGGGADTYRDLPSALVGPLAAHLASLAPDSWPFVNGVEHDDDCALRTGAPCSCFAAYPTRVAVEPDVSVADAVSSDRFANSRKSPREELLSMPKMFSGYPRGAANAFLAAFLFPSFLLFAGVALATLPGCASVKEINAIAQAETVEQRAFAAYGSFTVIEEQAASIIDDKRIPKATRKRIQQVDKIAKPSADTLIQLARELRAARNRMSVSEFGSTSAQVAALSTELANALVLFGPKLSALVAAVNSVKQ